MPNYAQTNIQLYKQLREANVSAEGQKTLFNAYTLASELFGAQYRGSGKTFISHLVGTASVLITHGATVNTAAAGLLHAAILHGDFGYSPTGKVSNRYNEIQQRVGDPVAKLVRAFSRLPWGVNNILNTPNQSETTDPLTRDVFFIRLANDLEVLLDDNLFYCANTEERVARLHRVHFRLEALADELGFDSLADELRQLFHQCQNAHQNTELSGTEANSYTLTPRSCRARLGEQFKLLRQRLRRHTN